MSKISIFQDLMPSILNGSWAPAIRKHLFKDGESSIEKLCRMMMESDGEYSSLLISGRLLSAFEELDREGRVAFFQMLNSEYDLDAQNVEAKAREYAARQDAQSLHALTIASEPGRQELFRRLNLAPGGIRRLVKMREELQKLVTDYPALGKMDADFRHLFNSWFNRGFLTMLPIDWETPAHILEKIIVYEAVHEIGNWDELRSRVAPADRYCYGFFHPAMEDEPLVFVEVALTDDVPERIDEILSPDRKAIIPENATSAVFYSISNCHSGLSGVSFGNLLIKQVVTSLKLRFPNLKTFATISPAPGFRSWLKSNSITPPEILEIMEMLDKNELESIPVHLKQDILHLGARYFLEAKSKSGRPLDPVSKFHLKNGARLERINFMANTSFSGMEQSLGLMVNYIYNLQKVEENHEKYINENEVVCSGQIKKLLAKGSG